MNDILGPVAAWVGVLDAVGIGVAFLAWLFLRGGEERTRAIAAAVGAVFLASALVRALGGIGFVASQLAVYGFEREGLRRLVDVAFVLAGVVAGLYAVSAGHRRLDEQSAYDDDADDAYDDDEDREETEAPEPSWWTTWFDVVLLVVAIALPVAGERDIFGFGPGGFDLPRGEVHTAAAIYHLWLGVVTAAPLLVLLVRDEIDDLKLVAGAFAVVAAGAVVRPIWPEAFSNEFWTTFALGAVAGLVGGVALSLIRPAISADRAVNVIGVVVAVLMLTLTSVLVVRALVSQQNLGSFGPDEEGLGRSVPFGELARDQLGDLRGVQRGALAQVVAAHEQVQRTRVV